MKKRSGFSQVLSKISDVRGDARFCPLELADFHICGETDGRIARVTLVTDNREYSETEIANAFLGSMDRRARLIEQSTARTGAAQNGKRFYTALAKLNPQSIPYDENIERMQVLSSSTFLDDKDNVWRVEGDGDQRRLYINTEDDMVAILAARRKHHMLPETASQNRVPNGEYCMYYSATAGKYAFGISLNTTRGMVMIDRHKEESSIIDPALVVIAEAFDNPECAAVAYEDKYSEVSQAAATKLLAYYRKMFGNTAFFVKLESAIKQAGA